MRGGWTNPSKAMLKFRKGKKVEDNVNYLLQRWERDGVTPKKKEE